MDSLKRKVSLIKELMSIIGSIKLYASLNEVLRIIYVEIVNEVIS